MALGILFTILILAGVFVIRRYFGRLARRDPSRHPGDAVRGETRSLTGQYPDRCNQT